MTQFVLLLYNLLQEGLMISYFLVGKFLVILHESKNLLQILEMHANVGLMDQQVNMLFYYLKVP